MRDELYEAIIIRSDGRCEAEVESGGQWMRCTQAATDVHHLLPKSRGGRLLDAVLETAHLIHLCREDHQQAHSRKNAEGMMIDGSVTWNKITNRPEYQGTDPYLRKRYPKSMRTNIDG